MSFEDKFMGEPILGIEKIEEEELDYENDETIDEAELEKREKENKSLLYQTRVRSLINSVAEAEGYDIQIGRKGLESFNESIKFITVMLAYEIIEELRAGNRKKITPLFVEKALSKMLGRADALGLAIKELEQVLENLEVKSSSTSISKAMDYLNILVVSEEAEKEISVKVSEGIADETKIDGLEGHE